MPDPLRAVEDRREDLRRELLGGIDTGSPEWWAERFDHLAAEIFRHQCETNPVYGRFVGNRGVDPAQEILPDEIPAVPASGFKDVPLVCGDPRDAERVFLTSGTTRGGTRGKHYVRDLSLYRASLLRAARPMLTLDGADVAPDTRTSIRILSLLPDGTARADSSLAYMIGSWMEAWGDDSSRSFADAGWRLDFESFHRAITEAAAEAARTLVVGTAFSFVHWLDERPGETPPLPEGSIVVETGGFKGRSRRVDRTALYTALSARLGVPMGRIVNEYGMTEMLSQFYEPVLTGQAPPDPSARWHVGPAWVRTTILDPRTLEPVPRGEPGLLCHLDLANLDSVCRVLTEDLGVAVEGGFRLLGRVEGAEPRGCSLAADALRAAGGP